MMILIHALIVADALLKGSSARSHFLPPHFSSSCAARPPASPRAAFLSLKKGYKELLLG
jgi:hypothetical protein